MRTLTLLFTLALLAACEGDEGSATYIQASIDGLPWREAASEGIVAYTVEDPDGWIFTSASRSHANGRQTLILNIPMPVTVGTYPLDGHVANAAVSACPNGMADDCMWWGLAPGRSGVLTVTSVDHLEGNIIGSFSFDAYPLRDTTNVPLHLTSGKFEIHAEAADMLDRP